MYARRLAPFAGRLPAGCQSALQYRPCRVPELMNCKGFSDIAPEINHPVRALPGNWRERE